MNSLQVTVHHAVRHLCGPLFLSRRTSESVVNKFSALLYDNLVRKYTLMKRWDVYQPSLYEEERALHISSSSRSAPLTPIALGRICKEAGLSYDYWMAVMEEFSGRKVDFKMYINPNSVSVVHAESRVRDELWAPKPFEANDEEDDNALLAEAADCAMKSPGFQLEVQSESPRSERSQLRFPVPRLSSVPTSAKISHSRTSSSSSNLSSSSQGSSYYFDSPMSSTASLSSDESDASWTQHQPSRSYATYADNNTCTQIGFDPATFELPVDFKVSGIWVDFERPAIKYDGGRTMVLSGGVMLGRRL